MKPNPLTPSTSVLVKLGSIAVHVDEMKSYKFNPAQHGFVHDLSAIEQLLDDPEIKEWMDQMGKMAFLPVKRS